MSDGVITSVLRWLRAGYPEGVPPRDYFPLLALLRRTLTEEQFAEVIGAVAGADPDPVRMADIHAALEHVTTTTPNEDDVRQVAARLAAAGWPLSEGVQRLVDADRTAQDGSAQGGTAQGGTDAGDGRGIVQRVLDWLRTGYPEGVPAADRVPLLALLRRRLGDDEVREVAEALAASAGPDGEVSQVDARVLMTRVLDSLPSEEDLARVAAHLEMSGIVLV
jgi:hypothetical protein